jgi:hypothetical protein
VPQSTQWLDRRLLSSRQRKRRQLHSCWHGRPGLARGRCALLRNIPGFCGITGTQIAFVVRTVPPRPYSNVRIDAIGVVHLPRHLRATFGRRHKVQRRPDPIIEVDFNTGERGRQRISVLRCGRRSHRELSRGAILAASCRAGLASTQCHRTEIKVRRCDPPADLPSRH